MGTVHKFRPPANKGQFEGEAPRTAIFPSRRRRKRRSQRLVRQAKLALFGVVLASATGFVVADRLTGGDLRLPPAAASSGGWQALIDR